MSLFRAAAGLALGGAAFGLAAWGLDPDFLVENDQIKDLATALATPETATQLKDFAQVVDVIPKDLPADFHVFEGVVEGGKHLLVNTEKAMPFIPGAPELNAYFGHSINPVTTWMTQNQNVVQDFIASKSSMDPATVSSYLETLKDHAGEVAEKLGDTSFERALSNSTLAMAGGGALGMGAIGALQGNNPPPVVGKFTEQETLRRQASAGRGGQLPPGYDVSELSQSADRPQTIAPHPGAMQQQAHAANAPQPGGSKVADYLKAMQEASGPEHAAPGGRA